MTAHDLCSECSEPFTDQEWTRRHSDDDGQDIHDECCSGCFDSPGQPKPDTNPFRLVVVRGDR